MRTSMRWVGLVGAAMAAVAAAVTLSAVIGRTTEAEVIGANIGAGLAILFLGPMVAALLVWSLAWTIYLGGLTAPFVSPVQRPAVAG